VSSWLEQEEHDSIRIFFQTIQHVLLFGPFPIFSKRRDYLFVYNSVFDMLKQARGARPKRLGQFLLLVSVIRGFLPTFYRSYRVYHEHDDIPVWTGNQYIVVILLLTNILFF